MAKSDRKTSVPEILRANGIDFETFNNGLHLRIYGKPDNIDVWPTSLRWRVGNGPTQTGISNLVLFLRPGAPKPELSQEEIDLIIEDLIHVANHYEPDSPEEHELRKAIIKKLGGDVGLVEDP